MLLDTCAFIWLSNGYEPLPTSTLASIQDDATEVILSVVTPWEMTIKAAKHGIAALQTREAVDALVAGVIVDYKLTVLPIRLEHALRVGSLPLHHRDPFDRMLIAQALIEDVPIATPDPAFAPYGVKLLWE